MFYMPISLILASHPVFQAHFPGCLAYAADIVFLALQNHFNTIYTVKWGYLGIVGQFGKSEGKMFCGNTALSRLCLRF